MTVIGCNDHPSFFRSDRINSKSLRMKRVLYAGDFLFDVLLQITPEHFAWHSSNCHSGGFELAVEALEKTAHSTVVITGSLFMQLIIFPANYCELL